MPVKIKMKETKASTAQKPIESNKQISPLKISQERKDNLVMKRIRQTISIMVMDVRMLIHPELKKEYQDYANFCELARGKK
jgi:hypothetical protein